MTKAELFYEIREHYVAQFVAFIRDQQSKATEGASEVKLELSSDAKVFRRLYCVDFIADGGIVELMPDRVPQFDPIESSFGDLSARIESLCWDDVAIRFEATTINAEDWFEEWFDPDEKHFDRTAELTGRIHSLSVSADRIDVDLGSAPPEALIDLLKLLRISGVRRVTILSSR